LLIFLAINIHLALCFEISRLLRFHPLTKGGYFELRLFLGSFLNLGIVH
jgi:putative component of membrane protein insertase Oxa1/YidC/SpoIIIJ protein YidD